MVTAGIDFIGDIHGHREKLEALLSLLGYSKQGGAYRHPERVVLFLGDYLDRGPDVRGAVNVVRAMVDAGSATALLGNHEFNALSFWIKQSEGGYLREHTINKILIHVETMRSYQKHQSEFHEMLRWLYTLPLYVETETFRAQHACWDSFYMEPLKKLGITTLENEDRVRRCCDKKDPLYWPIDRLLKGPEVPLPEGVSFYDSEGVRRVRTRICWWKNPQGKTINELAIQSGVDFPECLYPLETDTSNYYGESERPVFFGHYWLAGSPLLFRENVCCLDYSVASYKGNGTLAAYRFDGEQTLDNRKIVYV